jgi:hypothetical protein
MVKFAASGSEAVAFRVFTCVIAGYKDVLNGGILSRALAWSYKQCSTFTNQSIILKGRHFV